MATCGNWCYLAPDVLASAQVPHERVPRKITCQLSPHDGPCEADGWAWLDGQIWRPESIAQSRDEKPTP
jgi:hypothetical protein